MRASILHNILATIEELPDARRVLASLPLDLHNQAHAFGPREWLDVSMFVPVYRVLWAQYGYGGCVRFFRDATHKAVRGPMFQPLVRGLLLIFRGQVYGLLSKFDYVQRQTSREVARFEVDRLDASRARVLALEVTPLFRQPWYAAICEGSFGAAVELAGREATIERDLADIDEGRLVYTVSWS